MFKNFLKILAALTGISVIAYFLKQKMEVWELDAVKDAPKPIDPAATTAEKHVQSDKDKQPKPTAKPDSKTSEPANEPIKPGARAQAEASLEAEVAPARKAEDTSENKEKANTDAANDTSKTENKPSETKAKPEPATQKAQKADEDEDEHESGGPVKNTEIDFSKIGTATAGQKDDLKKIKGIGKALETKLNTVGIYTYQQIANFTTDVEEQVTEAISFFPGRVDRDEWVSQAKALLKDKA